MGLVTFIAACTLAAQPALFVPLGADPDCQPAAAAGAAARASGAGMTQWEPYIIEAAERFDVPPQWVRQVMRAESGGRRSVGGRPITSRAGAMGIMQTMPRTYAALRKRYALGRDPYDPRNSILAGTAYIREMYDAFGAPGFAAAYNAGPARFATHLVSGRPLPKETRRYLVTADVSLDAASASSAPLTLSIPTGQSGANSTTTGDLSESPGACAEPPNLGDIRADGAPAASCETASDSTLFVQPTRHAAVKEPLSLPQPAGRFAAERHGVGAPGMNSDDALFVTLGTAGVDR